MMKSFNVVFCSSHIHFVNVGEKLVADYLVMVNDNETQRFITHKERVYTREDEINWVKAKLEKKAYVFSMFDKDTGEFIGNIELMDVENKRAEVGICITKSMQDKHYGTEALKRLIEYSFNELGLEKLTAVVFSNNLRSIHTTEKVGFKKSGILEKGEIVDDVHFVLERSWM